MKKILFTLLLSFPFLIPLIVSGQGKNRVILDQVFKNSTEVYFTTSIHDKSEVHILTKLISIDNVNGKTVYAYASRKQFGRFLELGYAYTVLPHPGSLLTDEELNMGGKYTKGGPLTTWNFYPTYEQYIDEMNGFAASYPAVCEVVPIGTSIEGRQIIAVKIGDSLNVAQGEPEVFLTSSIHGDETTGYVLMLHLIDSLLSGYGQNARITNLVNNFRIFINPLANPDGTYHGGNTSVSGARRENANDVDLNRNFPDPEDGQHPYGEPWQPETEAFMRFDSINHFVMSMNFHGGEEVFNYPWDTWPKLHADDAWFNYVGREYADTVHLYGPGSYFIGPNYNGNGVTNGFAWYEVNGGRQDYTTYFHNGREVTLEISVPKTPAANQLVNYWNYNCRSFLNYIEEAYYGINGNVTDSVTGAPLAAKVMILGHDKDNSYVYSKLPSGWYFRPVYEGTYALNFSCPGYFSKTILGISATNRNTTRLNVKLVPLSIGVIDERENHPAIVYPNPSDGNVRIMLRGVPYQKTRVEVFNTLGIPIMTREINVQGESSFPLDLSGLNDGLYLFRLTSGSQTSEDRIIIRK